jgi:polyhydroxyalkanoate synthesis regulator phasin
MNLSFTKALAGSGKTIPEEATMTAVLYRPGILASAQVRFIDRRYSLDMQHVKSALVTALEKRAVIRWDDFVRALPDENEMDPAPDPQARFATPDGPLSDARLLNTLRKDFSDWAYRTSKVTVRANNVLGVFATPEVSQADFMKACAEAARQARDTELAKTMSILDRQIAAIRDKLSREERELQQDQTELDERKREEMVAGAETVFSLLGGRRSRRISEALSKHRMTKQSKADVDESVDVIAELKQQLTQLEQARQLALEEAGAKWGNAVNNVIEIPILAKKTDVYVNLFGVAWMPYYHAKVGDQMIDLPAFE